MNYKNWSVIQKYITFGKAKTNVNKVEFVWYDSFTKEKRKSDQPFIEMYSSIYNWGIAHARLGCYSDLSGDGIKQASNNFQKGAWIFEHLGTMLSQLPAGENSSDFSKESLSMNSNLCLAQAQYLFYKKASDAGMKPMMLAKICA